MERARTICPLFPAGEIVFSECPDFRVETDAGSIGIEVTQLFRLSMETTAHHREVVLLAEKKFYQLPAAQLPAAQPVFVNVGFLSDEQCERENRKGWDRLIGEKTGRKKHKLANSLTDFVDRHIQAGRFGTFADREMDGQLHTDTLPTGFEVIHVSTTQLQVPWRCGESANMSLDERQLYDDLHATITKKNEKLRNYRMNAVAIPIWLLIYSGPSLTESVWVPASIGDWSFASDFDRVLLLSIEKARIFEVATFRPATIPGTQI
ncbi:MAG: hypothetical protein ABSG13_18560 [Bryobacteraceae bacterium]